MQISRICGCKGTDFLWIEQNFLSLFFDFHASFYQVDNQQEVNGQ